MSSMQWRKSLLLAVIVSAATESLAFQHPAHSHNHQSASHHDHGRRQRHPPPALSTTASAEAAVVAPPKNKSASGECYYRRIDGPWRPRKELSRLFVGERLFATRLPESDLFEGKTGPKVFLECGIGRKDQKGNWIMVNGMVRIGKKGMKKSVVRKKVKRMPSNTIFEVFVSKINLSEGIFEVCLNRDQAVEQGAMEPKIPASSLKEGEALMGTVKQVKPYGVFVDVNANRNGLLHITKVAKQQDSYVNKEDGLNKLGLGRGSKVNVIVVRNEKKRLEFDFAPVVEESPAEDGGASDEAGEGNGSSQDSDASDDEAAMWAAYAADPSSTTEESSAGSGIGDDEAAMWAAYATDSPGNTDEDGDGYDEDADIEDALGLGSY